MSIIDFAGNFYNKSTEKHQKSSTPYFVDDFKFDSYKNLKGDVEDFMYTCYDKVQEFLTVFYYNSAFDDVFVLRMNDKEGGIHCVHITYKSREGGAFNEGVLFNTLDVLLDATEDKFSTITEHIKSGGVKDMYYMKAYLVDTNQEKIEEFPEPGRIETEDVQGKKSFSTWDFYGYKRNVGTVYKEGGEYSHQSRRFYLYRIYQICRKSNNQFILSKFKNHIIKDRSK